MSTKLCWMGLKLKKTPWLLFVAVVGRDMRQSSAVSGNSTGMVAMEQLPKYCSCHCRGISPYVWWETPLCSADLFQVKWKKGGCVCVHSWEYLTLHSNFTLFSVKKFCREAYVWFLAGLKFEFISLRRIPFSLLSSVRAFTAEMDSPFQPFMFVQLFLHCQNSGS